MSESKNVYQRIHAVMAEIGTITKTGVNNFHNYKYVKESDYVEALRPLLIKHGLAVIPSLADVPKREGDITSLVMKFTIVNIDNPTEKVEAVIPSSGQDKGDKGVYKAITGAKKYFFANTFAIATGDDPENDGSDKARVKVEKKALPAKKAVTTHDDF
jgi:hypothetical protein